MVRQSSTHMHKTDKTKVYSEELEKGFKAPLVSIMIIYNDGPILTLQNQVTANSPGKTSHTQKMAFLLYNLWRKMTKHKLE